jgi:hypothetical protein
MSLRPRELGPARRWWFKVEVDFEQIKATFPAEESSIAEKTAGRKGRKGKKRSPLEDFAKKVLQEHYPDGPPLGVTLKALEAVVEKTGGPEQRKDFTISYKTIGRAAEKAWPGFKNCS